jgi:hypothetical protein
MSEHEQERPERQREHERQQYPDFDEREERAGRVGIPHEDEREPDPHERGNGS